jgi:ATP-dependent RNA helicase RhlE
LKDHYMTTSFEKLGLIEPIRRALQNQQYETPTPIQAEAIPALLAGNDLLGSAQTGTGKTAAFALPILQRLAGDRRPSKKRSPRALILTPTRELANQIGASIKVYGRYLRVSHTVVYGGVSIVPQARALSRSVDILVATPGRLLDLMGQRLLFLDRLELFTLDEADRMLDMGFIHDVRKIIAALPETRQTLFFSATMPKDAMRLADRLLRNPVKVQVDPVFSTVRKVEQKVLFVERHNKEALLLHLLEDETMNRALVFTRTKHKANNIARKLNRSQVQAEAIHGNKSQSARMQALRNFSDGRARVLVATDVASRGIDIKEVSHVINFEMPNEPESYIHRIGRTARAGAAGIAISFCDIDERAFLRDIEKLTRTALPVDEEHPYHSAQAAKAPREGLSNTRHPAGRQRKRGSFRARRHSFRPGRKTTARTSP